MRAQRVYHRVFQALLVGAAAAALTLAGCKKSQDEGAETKDKDNGDEAAAGGETDRGTRASGEMPSGVSYANFPADAEMLFGVSFASVRDSAIWNKYRDTLVSNLDDDGDFEDFQEACGFDPFTKLETVMFGGTTAEDRLVVVVHGFSRDEIRTCGEGMAAKKEEEFTATDEGQFSHYKVGDEELWVAWVGDRTMLTGPRAETDKAWLEARVAGKDGLAADSGLAQLVESSVDRGAGVWFGMIPSDDSPLGAGMAMTGSQPEAMYGWVAPSDGLAITAGVRFPSAEQAAEVLAQAQTMLQMVKLQAGDLGKFVDKAQMSTNDADMVVSISLSEPELTELVDSVGAMFGGMFGMP
jgi:hypothetical protein